MATCPHCLERVFWSPCQRCGRPWEYATITETDVPGLFDVRFPDGREMRDVTTNQVTQLVDSLGLVRTP